MTSPGPYVGNLNNARYQADGESQMIVAGENIDKPVVFFVV